jgi:hypothetical protein
MTMGAKVRGLLMPYAADDDVIPPGDGATLYASSDTGGLPCIKTNTNEVIGFPWPCKRGVSSVGLGGSKTIALFQFGSTKRYVAVFRVLVMFDSATQGDQPFTETISFTKAVGAAISGLSRGESAQSEGPSVSLQDDGSTSSPVVSLVVTGTAGDAFTYFVEYTYLATTP